jgi:hypothetical protein
MKIERKYLLVILTFLLVACSDVDKIKMIDCTESKDEENCIEKYVAMDKINDEVISALKSTVVFFEWYNKNAVRLNQDGLVKFSDSLGFYIFDKVHADSYISAFSNTNRVSKGFVNNLKKQFESYDVWLNNEKIDRSYEGPVGFEVDLIYQNQDVDYNMDLGAIKLDEFKISKDRMELITAEPMLFISFVKDIDGNWKIDTL